MRKNTEPVNSNEMISLPVVRIDALDELYIQPLREFFALNGCQVYINSSPSADCTYHLIVGDLLFVKHILDNHKMTSQKAMSIVWGAEEQDVLALRNSYSRYALIDPKPLTGELLKSLCNFFFTGSQKLKNFQASPPQDTDAPKKVSMSNEKIPKQREQPSILTDIQRIARTMTQVFPSQTKLQTKRDGGQAHKKMGQRIRCIILAIVILCLPACIYLTSLGLLFTFIYKQAVCVTKNTTRCIWSSNKVIHTLSTTARSSLSFIQIPLKLTSRNTIANEDIITALEKLSSVLQSSAELETVASEFTRSFLTTDLSKQDTVSTVVQIEKMKTQLFSLHANLDLSYRMFEQIVNDPPFPLSLPYLKTKGERGVALLADVRTRIQTAERLLLLYPYVAGYKTPLRLLVLLQNNTELRPTGGFIGSLMDVTIEDGTITTMNVEDVYEVDGQLKGHVDPPQPIRDILTQEHWYLRDSNWDPDFSQTAKKALWFYEKETGKAMKGVLAVNSSFIVRMLTLLGSIQLPDTKDTITADNFYAKSLAYTQTDFFPGSTQKRDFLGSLMNAITTTVLGNKTHSGMQLFELINQSLRERDIQMYFADPEAQQLAEQFAWAGLLPAKKECSLNGQIPCLFQYGAIIEANLGVNKANYFIQRNDSQDMTIDASGKITETLSRTIKNTATDQPGSGIYKNYMRFYLPKNARVTEFTIDNTAVPAKPTGKNAVLTLPYGELDLSSNPFAAIVAVVFTVKPNQTTTISITYEYIGQHIRTSKDVDMNVFSQKQSGIMMVPTIIRIHFPVSWTARGEDQNGPATVANDGYLEYNTTMSQDSDIQIHFTKE